MELLLITFFTVSTSLLLSMAHAIYLVHFLNLVCVKSIYENLLFNVTVLNNLFYKLLFLLTFLLIRNI